MRGWIISRNYNQFKITTIFCKAQTAATLMKANNGKFQFFLASILKNQLGTGLLPNYF
jgi:hypothetical protein